MTQNEKSQIVRYEIRDQAAWIVLDRPAKRNALSRAMVRDLGEAIARASADGQARAIVLTGSAPAFCAGADLKADNISDAIVAPKARSADSKSTQESPFVKLLCALKDAEKPVIAAVNGAAFGGGLGLVAAADIAIASKQAMFSFSEVRLGLVPAMISVVVLPKLGSHNARRLFLTGRKFSAEDAKNYGLVHQVCDPEELEDTVHREVADLAKGGPEALAATKRLIRELPGLPEAQAFAHASALLAERLASDEGREGVKAFADQRAPRWCP